MCLSALGMAALGGIGAAAVGSMMKPSKQEPLADPAVQRAKAEAEAAANTSSKLAARNKARAASSLLAKPLDSTSSDVTALGAAPGKTSLGQ